MNESTQPKAKKSLGQHFLRHESICNRIASLLGKEPVTYTWNGKRFTR